MNHLLLFFFHLCYPWDTHTNTHTQSSIIGRLLTPGEPMSENIDVHLTMGTSFPSLQCAQLSQLHLFIINPPVTSLEVISVILKISEAFQSCTCFNPVLICLDAEHSKLFQLVSIAMFFVLYVRLKQLKCCTYLLWTRLDLLDLLDFWLEVDWGCKCCNHQQ